MALESTPIMKPESEMDITIRVGGEAGQGLQYIGSALGRILSRSGLHVFTHQDYMSRVRGGHNFYQIQISDRQIHCATEKIDILLALDNNTITLHRDALNDGGIIVYDQDLTKKAHPGPEYINIPFMDMTEQLNHGQESWQKSSPHTA